jgi:hypothetical protein
LFLNISLKKRALQIGFPRDIDGPMKIQIASGLHLTLPAASINYYKQVEACVQLYSLGDVENELSCHEKTSGEPTGTTLTILTGLAAL